MGGGARSARRGAHRSSGRDTVSYASAVHSAALGIDLPSGATYGSLEGLYSIANTAQVAVVESTSGANPLLWSPVRPLATFKNGIVAEATRLDGALYDIAALSKAALAR